MASINRVVIAGNLCADPIQKREQSQDRDALAVFSIAHNTRRKDSRGELVDKPHFITVSAWGQQALYVMRNLHKGNLVYIDGRLDYHVWEAKDGSGKRSQITLVAHHVDGPYIRLPRENGLMSGGV